jgi:AraC-like DNA-binding protein
MEVKLFHPSDPELLPYIECFYILRRTADEPSVKYAAFPSIFSMVCMNARCHIAVDGHNLSFTHDPDTSHKLSLICDFEVTGWMTYEGAMDEVVIYFKPLAINAFLAMPLKAYIGDFFTPFNPYDDYVAGMSEIFDICDDRQRIDRLEKYWRSKFIGFAHPFLHEAIDEIVSEEFPGSVTELAGRHGVSRTTLVKHFVDYIGTTPSQFKKVARFRAAMKRKRDSSGGSNLSAISHEAAYFDQSHMIKDFRSLTSFSPKNFFANLSTLEGGHINWLFAQQP